MNNEYIVINKTELLKRIENLEDERDGFIYNPNKTEERICYNSKIELLKQILSQSTPLIPEIEKAFDEGKGVGIISYNQMGHTIDKELYNERKQHYISNLKLVI